MSLFGAELTWLLLEDDGTEQSTNNAPIPPGKARYDDGENSAIFVLPACCRILGVLPVFAFFDAPANFSADPGEVNAVLSAMRAAVFAERRVLFCMSDMMCIH